MQEALSAAARLVAPGGLLAFALYHRTLMCGFWRWEKRWYSGASLQAQRRARAIYVALLRTAFFVTGRDFRSHVANYHSVRGMDFMHDVHDWMGGYPYESILAPDVDALMRTLGFARVYGTDTPLTSGIFGSSDLTSGQSAGSSISTRYRSARWSESWIRSTVVATWDQLESWTRSRWAGNVSRGGLPGGRGTRGRTPGGRPACAGLWACAVLGSSIP